MDSILLDTTSAGSSSQATITAYSLLICGATVPRTKLHAVSGRILLNPITKLHTV
jgi:hypothetical protein